MTGFADALKGEIKRSARAQFDNGVAEMRSDWESASSAPGSDGGVPRRTGYLRSQLRTRDRSVTSNVFRITVELSARDGNFDYASFLNRAGQVTIVPQRAQALRFFGNSGETVFAQRVQYRNRWQGYWDRFWTEDRWLKALERTGIGSS